jgi:hypothetical protein
VRDGASRPNQLLIELEERHDPVTGEAARRAGIAASAPITTPVTAASRTWLAPWAFTRSTCRKRCAVRIRPRKIPFLRWYHPGGRNQELPQQAQWRPNLGLRCAQNPDLPRPLNGICSHSMQRYGSVPKQLPKCACESPRGRGRRRRSSSLAAASGAPCEPLAPRREAQALATAPTRAGASGVRRGPSRTSLWTRGRSPLRAGARCSSRGASGG